MHVILGGLKSGGLMTGGLMTRGLKSGGLMSGGLKSYDRVTPDTFRFHFIGVTNKNATSHVPLYRLGRFCRYAHR